MTILISTATVAKQALTNNFGLSSSDPSNLIFGTAFDETFNFSGVGNLSVVDVSNGDALILDSATTLATLNQTHLITVTNQGNDVVVSSAGTYTLGSLNVGETVNVSFNTATVTNDSLAISRVGNGFSYTTTTITGGMGNDSIVHSIVGSAGDDTFTMNSDNDTITGGTGNDTFNVSHYAVITDFTSGQDTLNISTNAQAGIYLPTTGGTFDYSTVTNNGGLRIIGDSDAWNVNAITASETITGSSGNDDIYGSYGSGNVLSGGAGNDYISSNGNNATLTGGSGNDYFGINSGTALITDFSNAEGDRLYVVGGTMTVPITVSTDFSNSTNFNFGTLRISAAEATAAVSITGSWEVDIITGSSGADTLNGYGGSDTYVVSATGQTGSAPTGWTASVDSISGGSTIDTTNMDIISINGDMLDLTAIAPTLTSVTATTTTIIDATSFIAAGTGTAAQSFKGAYANNTFTSSASGMDTLLVYDNNGSIEGGALEAVVLQGITTLAAYDGIITAPDSTPPQGYLGLDIANNVTVQSNERGTAYLYPTGTTVNPILTTALAANINVVLNIAPQPTAGIFDVVVKDIAGNATTSTTKVILGTTGDDALIGTSGSDYISGFAGNDTISGGAGNNNLIGGTGSDVFNVEGSDTIVDFTSGETLNISANSNAGIYLPATGGTFDYSNGTNNGWLHIYGTYDWNDNSITASETITGSSGYDEIQGGYGSGNVLSGGAGNDYISSNGNNDTLTGGAGSDYFDIYGDTALITDFSSAEGDSLYVDWGNTVTVPITASTNFSTFSIYGTLKISAAAATAAVSITGTNRLDIITGSSGADTLNGGNGLDTYVVSATGQTGSAPAAWTGSDDPVVFGSTIDTTSMDIISMLVMEGDKLDISAIASTLTSVTTTTTTIIDATSFTAAGTGTAAQSFKGAYANNTFTSSESGMDTLLVYDNNGSASGGALEAVVLVGMPTSWLSVSNGVFTAANPL